MHQRREGAPMRRRQMYEALNPRYDVRNIMSRSGQTIRCRASCSKAPGAKGESTWEARFCLRAEASADVKAFKTQPFRLPLTLFGFESEYTPDAKVELLSRGDCLVEVKRYIDLNRPDTSRRLTGIRAELAAKGYGLLWSTDRELDRPEENDRMYTVKIQRQMFTLRETEVLNGRLAHYETLTLGEATAILGSRARVLHLIARHLFYVDYRRPLSSDAVISRQPKEANHAVSLFSDW